MPLVLFGLQSLDQHLHTFRIVSHASAKQRSALNNAVLLIHIGSHLDEHSHGRVVAELGTNAQQRHALLDVISLFVGLHSFIHVHSHIQHFFQDMRITAESGKTCGAPTALTFSQLPERPKARKPRAGDRARNPGACTGTLKPPRSRLRLGALWQRETLHLILSHDHLHPRPSKRSYPSSDHRDLPKPHLQRPTPLPEYVLRNVPQI